MGLLSGIISDRLRRTMTTDEILNNPHPDRSASPTPKKIPRQVSGTQLSKPDRRTTK
jgi:hypothetical protein